MTTENIRSGLFLGNVTIQNGMESKKTKFKSNAVCKTYKIDQISFRRPINIFRILRIKPEIDVETRSFYKKRRKTFPCRHELSLNLGRSMVPAKGRKST